MTSTASTSWTAASIKIRRIKEQVVQEISHAWQGIYDVGVDGMRETSGQGYVCVAESQLWSGMSSALYSLVAVAV